MLIVDDEPALQYLFEQFLLLNGFEIVGIACNGEEAVNLYKSISEKPDIILMDHRMPVKNGLEATKEILEIDNLTKIIFTSADSSIKEEALSIGAIDFQAKPFDLEMLIENIQRILSI